MSPSFFPSPAVDGWEGWTTHLSPIHRASSLAWAQAGLQARWIGLAIRSGRYPAV